MRQRLLDIIIQENFHFCHSKLKQKASILAVECRDLKKIPVWFSFIEELDLMGEAIEESFSFPIY